MSDWAFNGWINDQKCFTSSLKI